MARACLVTDRRGRATPADRNRATMQVSGVSLGAAIPYSRNRLLLGAGSP
jgi:hypothetical protein